MEKLHYNAAIIQRESPHRVNIHCSTSLLCVFVLLTLYVSVPHVFTVLGKGILEILCRFQLNKCLSTGTAFFRVGETHSVYFPNDVTVCK